MKSRPVVFRAAGRDSPVGHAFPSAAVGRRSSSTGHRIRSTQPAKEFFAPPFETSL